MTRAELVSKLRAGDEAAWREFLQRYGNLVYSVGVRLGLTPEERDDLFQNTCLVLLRSLDTLKDPGSLLSWLVRIAHNQAVDTLRRRRGQVAIHEVPEGRLGTTQSDPAEEIARLEEVARLMDAMERLDPRCRRLLTRLYLEQPRPSYQRISREEGLPVGSIGPIRARCLRRLQRLYEGLSGKEGRSSSQ
jgi:RNA polymerase sigma factor (sigma-70 family)